MAKKDYELLPRTYSIKGYRRRKSLGYKAILFIVICLSVLALAAVIFALSYFHLI